MATPNRNWRFFSRLCTCFIPNICLHWVGDSAEEIQAWREKAALCLIMLIANVGFLSFGGLVHLLECGADANVSCGNGVQGNGICSDGSCCSEHGWCGYTPDHCDGMRRKLQSNLEHTDNLFGDDDVVRTVVDPIEDAVNHENPTCRALNRVMLAIMLIIVTVLAVQCLCSLMYLVRWGRWCCKKIRGDRKKDAKVIVMVPCYSEGEDELKKTIESVRDEDYPNENKLLLFIADGNVRGKDSDGGYNDDTTPSILSQLLGYEHVRIDNDIAYDCDSTGFVLSKNNKKIPIGNQAKCFAGTCRTWKDNSENQLKYIVIEKCGLPNNKDDVGNRGKRDSQIILSRLLNKVMHNRTLAEGSQGQRDLNELERTIYDSLIELGLPLASDDANANAKYLMAVDADTRLGSDSVTQMVYSMESNPKTLALCGETKVENKHDSWVTKLQVFEYYTNHHLKKAFESIFGTVTCLPGCFTMYRLFDGGEPQQPLFACDYVCDRYSKNDADIETLHEKNLYKLGEDRMLTSLLLQKFKHMNLKYVPEAHCYTIVPDTLSVLMSQRRRWVNSTFHNMLYLSGVGLGGICCCSMKFILILDMAGTLILPSTLLYVGIMAYNAFVGESQLSTITLLVFGFSVFVQLIDPLLRLKLNYLWSAVIYYVVGVPIFYFVLPIYSFWKMDDFSWGATRQVASVSPASGFNHSSNDATSIDE